MNQAILLNPNGELVATIAKQLRLARKTKPIWAKRIEAAVEVETREGRLQAQAGDYLCRGIAGEYWPQKEAKLTEKYSPSTERDAEGLERFDPKPESAPVEATAVDRPFRVAATWGELTGKPGDYVVRSTTDPDDVWIVGKTIFEASYEMVDGGDG
jgi:hypothetical protein